MQDGHLNQGAIIPAGIEKLIAKRCLGHTPAAVASFAGALAKHYGGACQGVIAYGSCLRDVDVAEGLIDLYVLADAYSSVHRSRPMRAANALVPPNVYYAEHDLDGAALRAKYALVTLDQFERKVARGTANPYFWARFAQPCAIAFAADDTTKARMVTALATAVDTFLYETRGLSPAGASASDRWSAGLAATYATELRPEARDRTRHIVSRDMDYYDALYDAWSQTAAARSSTPARSWFLRRLNGRLLSIARLLKAGFTFQGGADYLAWKIARHSGVQVKIRPWHRRHPILAAIVLSPRLYLRGGFR